MSQLGKHRASHSVNMKERQNTWEDILIASDGWLREASSSFGVKLNAIRDDVLMGEFNSFA